MSQLIGGPAVRRVDQHAAYIWLVLERFTDDIDVNAWADDRKQELLCTCDPSSKKPIRLGEKIYVYLLKLIPNSGSMNIDQVFYYDLNIEGKNLFTLNLIEGMRTIVYGNNKLPSFYLPSEHTNILQGSCRKPHSGKKKKSRPDQMMKADAILKASIKSEKNRPSQLYLTGDQIYADDVGTSLLSALINKGKHWRGHEELPLSDGNSEVIVPAKLQLASRYKIMNDEIGFTSGEAKNHLMTLGEYIAMYLVSWGGINVTLPTFHEVKERLIENRSRASSVYRIFGNEKYGLYQGKNDYKKERGRIIGHLKNSWRVRRLMANISTYMIFDDHDVTDDWNLNPDIHNKLRTNSLSKRVVGNALAAYWACQGWGNDPENVDHTNLRTLLEEAHGNNTNQTIADDALINRRWGYEIKQKPYAIVIDTRTHRVFDENDRPGLLDESGLDWLREKLKNPDNELDGNTLLLISPAPVYGFKAVELLQVNTPRRFAEMVDLESWISNKKQYESFKSIIHESGVKDVVVFSGDVHYGFVRREISKGTTVWQLTSSAVANSPVGDSFLVGLLENITQFRRKNTPYLIPNNIKSDFINSDSTIGHLVMEEGRPKEFNAYCKNDKGQSYTWKYDLENPKLFNR